MMGNPSPVQWKKHVPFLGVLLLLFSAGPYISRPPWFDESLTLDWLVFPIYEIPFRYVIPNNHIFYTLCLSLWGNLLDLFGLHEILYFRILSLIFGGCAVWIIARRMNRAVGLYATLPVLILFSAAAPMILFSTALRGYIPALLFSFAAFLAAETWMKQKTAKHLLLYFVFCYLSVLTIPTNLLSIGAGLLFLLPLGLRSKKEFLRLVQLGLIALGAMAVAYLPILRKFLKVAQINEGWYSYPDFLWNYYGTILFVFIPVLLFCVIGVFRLPLKKYLRWRFFSFAAIFLTPLIFGFLFQSAPFPRVFFPLFGLFTVIFSYLLSGYLRGRKRILKYLPLLCSVLWILTVPHILPDISAKMFGEHYRDDLLLPYPMSQEFRPHTVAKVVTEAYYQGRMEYVYIDFDADPPSLTIQFMNLNYPFEQILRDHPKRGPVHSLPQGSWIICRDEQGFQRLKSRFRLTENYRMLEETSGLYQKIYVPE